MAPSFHEIVVELNTSDYENYKTIIKHGEHLGWLKDGKLLCQDDTCGHFQEDKGYIECTLDFDDARECTIIELENHIHGPDCGHEKVPHADHFDYLVGSRLHHIVNDQSTCCKKQCISHIIPSTIVDHGYVNVVKILNGEEQEPLLSNHEDPVDIITTNIIVNGICCASETPIVHKIIESLPGVQSVNVNVITKNVKIVHDPSKTAPVVFVSALNASGLKACIGESIQSKSGIIAAHFPWQTLVSGLLLAVALFYYIFDHLEILKYIALISVFFGIGTLLQRAFASIKRFILDINVLMIIAVIGAIALGDYIEAAAVVFLFGLSEWLEDRCMGYARGTVSGLMEMQPKFATSALDNKSIPVEEIKVDDILIVRPGDRMPVNGIIVSGSSLVDESMLTGESKPIHKKQGDKVISGSLNSGKASLVVKATHLTSESMVAKLTSLVEDAATQKSQTDRIIEKFAKFYTPAIVIVAIFLTLLPLTKQIDDQRHWIKLSLVLLVTACPCALIISTPITVFCSISRAAHESVLIKGGKYLETLGKLKVLTFDKTGTLTEGCFKVIGIQSFTSCTEQDLLAIAASLELHSTHPMAPAIIGEAAAKGIAQKDMAQDVKTIPGLGITGIISGSLIAIGNLALMEKITKNINHDDLIIKAGIDADGSEKKICYICNDSYILGTIVLSDTVRPEARQAIAILKKMGLTLAMLTGDDKTNSMAVANLLGLDINNVHHNMLPAEKLSTMQLYRERCGPVAHIGDGINDSPALAAADVGIAMGMGGTALAVEAADVALFTNDLSKIITAIKISRACKWKIIQNIVIALAIKIFVLVYVLFGSVNLWQAVLADVGSSLLVIFNGILILFDGKSKTDVFIKKSKNRFDKHEKEHGHCHSSNSCSAHTKHIYCEGVKVEKPCCAKENSTKKSCCNSKH